MKDILQNKKQIIFGGFALLLVIVTVLAFVTYFTPMPSQKSFLYFAIQNHVLIMAILIVISISFGFYWSATLIREAKQSHNKELEQTAKSKSLAHIVWKFLDTDEKNVLKYLLSQEDRTKKVNQGNLSKLEGMHKVKAHRTVQKLKDKGLIIVTEHGKLKQLLLHEDVLALEK